MGIESPVCQIRDIGFDLTSNLFDRLKNKHNSGVITAITEKKKRERDLGGVILSNLKVVILRIIKKRPL